MEIGNYFIFFGFLAVAVVLTLLILLKEKRRKLGKKSVYVANTRFLAELPEFVAQYKKYKISLIVASILLAILLVVSSLLAGRVVTSTTITPQQYNRDIMLCLDVSVSMAAANEDVVETYLQLIEQFEGERVGMTVWNATAYQQFPFTDDYGYLKEQLTEMKDIFNRLEATPEDYALFFFGTVNNEEGSGSSLAGDGLATCVQSFDKQNTTEERYRSIIFATDNEVMGEESITLRQATNMLEEREISLYTINPYPNTTFARDLQADTENAGGRYYALDDSRAVTDIVEQINQDQIESFAGEKQRAIFDNPNLVLSILLCLTPLYLFFAARSRN